MRKFFCMSILAAGVLLVLASCGAAPATPRVPTPIPFSTQAPGAHDGHAASSPMQAGAHMIMMNMREFAFSPKTIHVKVGEPVNLMVINDGTVGHDMKIDALNFHAHAEANKTIAAGLVAT